MLAYLDTHLDRVKDLAYTLARRREHLSLRSYCIAKDRGGDENDSIPLDISPQSKFTGTRDVSFVFTGQGAQW